MDKIYKFKNVKHSVLMRFLKESGTGRCKKWIMENKDYKGLIYFVKPDEVEEVSNDRD